MNSLEPVQLSAKFKEENLDEIIELLSRELHKHHGNPVERTLDELSNNEVKRVRVLLAYFTDERLAQGRRIGRDYDSAQSIGRFIKWVAWALSGFVAFVVGVVKMAPGVVDWLRGVLK